MFGMYAVFFYLSAAGAAHARKSVLGMSCAPQAELSVEKEALTNRHAPAKFSHAENLSQKRKAYSQSHGHNDKVRCTLEQRRAEALWKWPLEK
jgi:hypothetical protein